MSDYGNFTVLNCSFVGNYATYDGGVVYLCNNTIFDVLNCSFVGNHAKEKGGVTCIPQVFSIFGIQNVTFSAINSSFEDNYANDGGVAYIYCANCYLTGSTFINNNASTYGGVAYTYGSIANIENSLFQANNALSSGGAFYIISMENIVLTGNQFIDNCARDGGALFLSSSSFLFKANEFIGNNASNYGGAVLLDAYSSSYIMSFENCTFYTNNAYKGGVVFNRYTIGNFTNCDFAYNNASYGGVAYHIDEFDSATSFRSINYFNNCHFFDNLAYCGSAVFFEGGLLNVTMSIFVRNLDNDIVYQKNTNNISIDNYTKYISDPDLLAKFSNITVKYDNYTYGNIGSIICNLSTADGTVINEGIVYLIINNEIYSANVSDGIGIIELNNLNVGNYTFSVIYNGSSTFAKTTFNSINLSVSKADSDMMVFAENITFGETASINISMVESFEGVVYLNYGGQNYTAYVTKGRGIIYIPGLNAGDYSLNVTFDSENYNTCIKTANFTVNKKSTVMYVSADNITYGDNLLINVRFYDSLDAVVYIIYNNTNYTATIVNGTGVFNISDLGAGVYSFNVTYDGSENFNPCSSIVNFVVDKSNPGMTLSALNITYGDVALVNVTLDKLVDGVAYIIYNEGNYSTNITQGVGTISIPGLNANFYGFSVIFDSENYSSVGFVNFTVNKQATSIVAKPATFVINYDSPYSVSFNVSLADASVSFVLNGKTIGNVKSDAAGVAKITISAAQLRAAGAGVRNIVASFAGNNNYLESSDSAQLTINKEATKFINVKSVKKSYKSTDKSIKLTATLKDSKNKVIKNQVVYFKVNNKKTFKVKTNSKGVATINLNLSNIKACKINKKGNYKFSVTYKTSATYKQASKKGKLKVI